MKITTRKLPNGRRSRALRRVFAGQLAEHGTFYRDGHYVIEAADGAKVVNVALTPREASELCRFHESFRVPKRTDH